MADKATPIESKGNSVIIYVNEFTEVSAKSFVDEFRKAIDNGQTVVPVFIDSYGGCVDSLSVMLDTIIAFPGQVATISIGKSCSCGSTLLACGSRGMRYAAPNSRIMVHQMSSMSWDNLAGMENKVDELKRLQNQIFRLMAKRCGVAPDYFLKLIKTHANLNIWMTPEEAKKHKMIDCIKYPLVKTETVTRITIE